MSHAIGMENGVPKAVFQDTRTLRFTCYVDPHGHLEVGTNRARPEMILGRETAGQLGRWLLTFEATGKLADTPPSLAALAAAVEDQAAKIDRTDARLNDHEERLVQRYREIAAIGSRLTAVEAALRPKPTVWQHEHADI